MGQGRPVVEKIELHVRSSNAPAQALYRKMGFTEIGRWRRRIKIGSGQYLDDEAMELFVKDLPACPAPDPQRAEH